MQMSCHRGERGEGGIGGNRGESERGNRGGESVREGGGWGREVVVLVSILEYWKDIADTSISDNCSYTG